MAGHVVGRPRRGALGLSRQLPYSKERLAAMLVPRRDKLVEQLPRELAIARGLSEDQAELVVDEAIDYVVTQYPRPLSDFDGVERAFWAAASLRARRVHEGRGATVRAGWKRVDVDGFDVPYIGGDPEELAIERSEREALVS